MKLNAAAKSDTGLLSDYNEDCFVARRELGLYMVADGVGGLEAGDVASKLACQLIEQAVRNAAQGLAEPSEHDTVVADAIRQANDALVEYAERESKKKGLGTTITLLWFHGDRVLFAYVGDSRIYLFRDGVLRQLSRDEKAGHYKLAASLGVDANIEPRLGMVRLRPGDRFLLCSDGLYGPVQRDDIAEILDTEPQPASCCERLVAAANDGGGPDNITALVADVVQPDRRQHWHFATVRHDATSLVSRLRERRKWLLGAGAGLLAIVLVLWAVSLGRGPEGPKLPALTGRLAVLAKEANDQAEIGDRAATLKALTALVHAAVREAELLTADGLALHPDAEKLYGQAARTVWDQLYAAARKKLDSLAGTPAEAYAEAELRLARAGIEKTRQQFISRDYRLVAKWFKKLTADADAIFARAQDDLRRKEGRVRNDIAVLSNRAREYEQNNPIRTTVERHIAAARAALDANDLAKAEKAIAAARAALEDREDPDQEHEGNP